MTDVNRAPEDDNTTPTENLGGAPFGVNVLFPETVTIRMVDASALGDYEFSILIASFCCNAAVGFLVAYLTAGENQSPLGWTSALFFVLTLAFGAWATSKRMALKRRAKTVKVTSGRVA